MTLVSSGTLGMANINMELGRAASTQISLDTAENGGYGAINTASPSRPNASNPAAISEWYGYNHNAVGVFEQRLGFNTSNFDIACENAFFGTQVRRTTDTQEFTAARRLYEDINGTRFAPRGWYADEFSGQARYWAGSSFTNGRACRI